MLVDDSAVSGESLVERHAVVLEPHRAGEAPLAVLDRLAAYVLAVHLEEVERAQDRAGVGGVAADEVEDGQALVVADDGLAVEVSACLLATGTIWRTASRSSRRRSRHCPSGRASLNLNLLLLSTAQHYEDESRRTSKAPFRACLFARPNPIKRTIEKGNFQKASFLLQIKTAVTSPWRVGSWQVPAPW